VDLDGQISSTAMNPTLINEIECTADRGVTASQGLGQRVGSDTSRESGFGFHDSKYGTNCKLDKRQSGSLCNIANIANKPHHSRVPNNRLPREADPWPQRLYVLGLIDAEVASGTPLEQIAQELGYESDWSLRTGYRAGHGRWPNRGKVDKIAARYGLETWQVWGTAPQGRDETVLARELLGLTMGADRAARLTDRQISSIIKGMIISAEGMLPE
jgi:hypothetical protein